MVEGEEVLTLHLDEQGTQPLFLDTNQKKWRPPLMEEEWVVLRQALYQSIREDEWNAMQESLKRRRRTSA